MLGQINRTHVLTAAVSAGAMLAVGAPAAAAAMPSAAKALPAMTGGVKVAEFLAESGNLSQAVIPDITDLLTPGLADTIAEPAAPEDKPDWVLPTRDYHLSARYGQPGGWSMGWHTGLDFAGDIGTPIHAARSGRVVEAQYNGAYGNVIQIKHKNGKYTLYAHLNSFKVHKGQKVRMGQVIGALGTTGNSTGPHLHFEVKRSKGYEAFINPSNVLDEQLHDHAVKVRAAARNKKHK